MHPAHVKSATTLLGAVQYAAPQQAAEEDQDQHQCSQIVMSKTLSSRLLWVVLVQCNNKHENPTHYSENEQMMQCRYMPVWLTAAEETIVHMCELCLCAMLPVVTGRVTQHDAPIQI